MEETGQTVQETQKVQAEQTGENGKNVGMPECETMELIMESRSENEEFARVVAAVFASRLDPTLEETGRYQDRRLRGSDERGDPWIPGTGREDLSVGDGMGKGAAVFCDGAG